MDEGVRRCKTCGDIKPLAEFHRGSGYVGGRHPRCNVCRGTKNPRWSAIRLENASLLGAGNRRCIKCETIKSLSAYEQYAKSSDGYNQACRACRRIQYRPLWRGFARRLRLEAIAQYGGKCFCCGEARFEFLAIDHINGGGNKERLKKIYKPGNGFVKWLKRNGWPTGLRVACNNCNSALGSFGYCPHQTKQSSFDEARKDIEEAAQEGELLESGRKRCSVCATVKMCSEYNMSSRSPTGYRGVCRPCEKTSSSVNRAHRHRGWTREMHLDASVKFNRRAKLEAIARYGGGCDCCGELKPEWLSIDHINGGGCAHRKSEPSSKSLVKWLKRNGWPKGYRVLCNNCNQSLGNYGYCPHKENRHVDV